MSVTVEGPISPHVMRIVPLSSSAEDLHREKVPSFGNRKPAWTWAAFITAVGLLLAFDLGVLHRKSHAIGVKESLGLSSF